MPNSLEGASKKAIYKSKVAQLDTLGVEKGSLKLDALNALEKSLASFIERVIDNINSIPDFVTTGSITDITLEPTEDGVNIVGPAHLIYQDRGVSGTEFKRDTPHTYTDKMPPIQVIKDWIKRKGLNLRDNQKYSGKEAPFKNLTDDQLVDKAARAIQISIYRNGISAKNIYSKEIPQLVEDIQKEIADFALQQIEQVIEINPREGGGNRIILK